MAATECRRHHVAPAQPPDPWHDFETMRDPMGGPLPGAGRHSDHGRPGMGGVLVAGIGALAGELAVPVAWTAYFALADADEAVRRGALESYLD
ncbi:hypothetical protein [Streptomyces sp. NBC_01353]|uniref:hypothetical protein n=1 Tax=Streptomyces sp. NBC_01353 TaxID=2903835 RepID=UPI003DA3CA27